MSYRIGRRTLLKGLGCSIGLPLLDAMMPTTALASTAKAPVRMAFVFFPNGAIMPAWTPKDEGAKFEMPETLASLKDVRNDVTIISGLAQDNGRSKGDGPGDHARSAASFLTGAHPVKTSGGNIKCGMSVDQVAATYIGSQTRLPSLEIGTERGRDAGSCDSGYSCAYSNSISWKSETTPMAKEINPRQVFERLFGSPGDRTAETRRNRVRRSVLDMVSEEAARLQKALGGTDRRKMDEYFTSVRELELRIARAEEASQEPPPEMDLPPGVPSDIQEHVRLMYDLMALAFQTDTTRIATFMLANEGSGRSYRNVGVNDGHHELSHHRNDAEKIEQLKKIDKFLADEFGRFVKKLKATPEAGGTLLDNCMILYGSGLSDGNRHRHDELPIVVAGKAGGTIKAGRHVRMAKETPMNNLFLSMLDRVGAKVDKLGDSSGRLTAIDT